MAERQNLDWTVLESLKSAAVAYVADEAVIRADASKGINEDVKVPFNKPVFNIQNAAPAKAAVNIAAEATHGRIVRSLVGSATAVVD